MTNQGPSSAGGAPIVPAPSRGPKLSTAGLGARVGIALLIIGLAELGAVAAWLVGESTHGYFKPSLAASANYRDPSALNREMPGVNTRNGALTYGPLGGLLGLALGLAGGLARRSVGGAMQGAAVGLLLGIAAGALPSIVVMPWHWENWSDDPATTELLRPLIVHLGLWSAAGLAAGMAFAIGAQGFKPTRLLEAALAGLAGAMLGIFVYELLGAFLFPFDHTAEPFPGTPRTRLLARLCIAGFVGLGAIRSLPSTKRTRHEKFGGT